MSHPNAVAIYVDADSGAELARALYWQPPPEPPAAQVPSREGAVYACLSCGFGIARRAGPVICQDCGALHLRWTNYEAMFGGSP